MNRYYGLRLYPWMIIDHPNDNNDYEKYIFETIFLPKKSEWIKTEGTHILNPIVDLMGSDDYPSESIDDTLVNILELNITQYPDKLRLGITRFGLLVVEIHSDNIELSIQIEMAYTILRDMISVLNLKFHCQLPRPDDLVSFKYFNYKRTTSDIKEDETAYKHMKTFAVREIDQLNEMRIGGYIVSPNTNGELGFYFTFDFVKSMASYRATKSEYLFELVIKIEVIDEFYILLIQLYQSSKEAHELASYRNSVLTSWTGIELLLYQVETARRIALQYQQNDIKSKYNMTQILKVGSKSWISEELKHALRSMYGLRGRITHTIQPVIRENSLFMIEVLRFFIMKKITTDPSSIFVKGVKEFEEDPNGRWIGNQDSSKAFQYWISKDYDSTLQPV